MGNYSEKLQDPRWQKKRLKILERDNWTCQKCRDKEASLHVHHLKYHKEPWEASDDDLITLCKHCHFIIENSKDHYENISITHIRFDDGSKDLYVHLKCGFPEYLILYSYSKISNGYVTVIPNEDLNKLKEIINA